MPTVPARSMKTIGAVIRTVRTREGLTQAELAEQMAMSRRYLLDMEKGVHNLFAMRLFRTLKRLKIRVTLTYEDTAVDCDEQISRPK